MKAEIHIVLDNGVISYAANVGNAEAIGLLEAAKFNILRNASAGGVGERPGEPAGPASGRNRAPGLDVRRVG